MATNTTIKPNLLTLPFEIRQRIYEMHFATTTATIHPASVVIERSRARKMQELRNIDDTTTPRNTKPHPDLAILQTCRQIADEACPCFYRTALFNINIMVRQSSFVPTEKLYLMRRFSGGAEVRQLLELDEVDDPRVKQHCIIGPFEPGRMRIRELQVAEWMSDPALGFMVDEANQGVQRPVHLDMYLSVYLPWLM